MKTLLALLVILLAACGESDGPDFDRSVYTFGEYSLQITDAHDTKIEITSSDDIATLIIITLSVDGKEKTVMFQGIYQRIDLDQEFSYVKILYIHHYIISQSY